MMDPSEYYMRNSGVLADCHSLAIERAAETKCVQAISGSSIDKTKYNP